MIPFPIQSNFIDQIFLFKRIDIKPNHFTRTHSLPSHLLHLLIEGEYSLTIQGRLYEPKKNEMIYYDQMEEVVWLKNEKPVSFYTLAFSNQKQKTMENNILIPVANMINNRYRQCVEKI